MRFINMLLNGITSKFNVSSPLITTSPVIPELTPTLEEKRWAKREAEALIRRARELDPFIQLHIPPDAGAVNK